MIFPPSLLNVAALTTPVILMTLSTTLFAAFADRVIVPPAAVMLPLFSTRASPSFLFAAIETNWSPVKSTVTVASFAAARVTRPTRAVMVPRFFAKGATKATRPLSRTVRIVPLLTTPNVFLF